MVSGQRPSPEVTEHWYTDVLIIGAGPSGLMAAQALSRLGVGVTVVERRISGSQYGNADGLQPRTLEIWNSYGLFDTFASQAAAIHAMVTYEKTDDSSGLVRSTPIKNVVVDSRYAYEMTASIDIIEGTLRDSLKQAGGRIMQPAQPLSIESSDVDSTRNLTYPIKTTIQRLGSNSTSRNSLSSDQNGLKNIDFDRRTVFAKFVIGADGAHSWVRQHLDISMEGDQTEYVWGVTDAIVKTDFPDCRFKCVIQSSLGALIIIPREDGKIRIYVQLPPQDYAKTQNGRLKKSSLDSSAVQSSVLARVIQGLRPYSIEFTHVFWCTIFSVPQKVASQYSVGRIFIVGDACHTHSPKAGQGANASMGDSHNLAWKIAYVLRGWAGEPLLETYEVERRGYAQELIAFDKRIARTLDGGAAVDYSSMLHEQNMFTSGIGICYRSRLTDPGVNTFAAYLQPGQRLPSFDLTRLGDWQQLDLQDLAPSDGLFKLLIFAGDILVPQQNSCLTQFAASLKASMSLQILNRLSLYTILAGHREAVHWKDVPPMLQNWKRVFISEQNGVCSAYEKFGIAATGAMLVVRPDGYISIITRLSREGALHVNTFLQAL